MVAAESQSVYFFRRADDHKGGGVFLAHDVAEAGIQMLFYGNEDYFLSFARIGAHAFDICSTDVQLAQ